MVTNNKTNQANDQLLISLSEPYKNITQVNGYECTIKGETSSTYFYKEFRYSKDGILYNDWRELNRENLQSLQLDSSSNFWPQYKFTQVGDGELEFETIALEVVSENGLIQEIPYCGVEDNGKCCGQQNLVFSCCDSGFNPYALGNSSSVYMQLSQVVSNMFGFCVQYFKTSADQRSKDVILHEYSLLNVIQEGVIKIVVPDNNLPTREINFNPLMMDYPTIFEIHIVKAAFRSVFGWDAKPEVGDYLYFEQYMNRMYEVNAVSETDDYLNTGAYWRVSLAIYQKRAATKFDKPQFEEDTDTLIFNMDKFNIEVENQEKDVRKPDQYNTIGQLENDRTRRILNKKLHIATENVYNNYTIISKYHYALKSIPLSDLAVQYRYDGGIEEEEERMIEFWFRAKSTNNHSKKHNIISIAQQEVKVGMLLDDVKGLKAGEWVEISGTDYPRYSKILALDNNTIILDQDYIDDCTRNPFVINIDSNEFINNSNGFSFIQTPSSIIVRMGENNIIFDLQKDNIHLQPDTWYGIMLAIKPEDRKVGLWIYELSKGTEGLRYMDSTLNLHYYKSLDIYTPLTLDKGYWNLMGSNVDFTGFRIWNQVAEESQHTMLLSQYVVKDSHLCELVDNAQPELLLDKVTNPK